MDENADAPKIIRQNVVYRSLRKSTARTLYSVKKKVASLHKSTSGRLNDQKGRQPLGSVNETPTPKHKSVGVGVGRQRSPRAAASAYRNPSLLYTPGSEAKGRQAQTAPFDVDNTPPAFVLMRANRRAKQTARQRIFDFQSPKQRAKFVAPHKLQLEVNELAKGIQEIHKIGARIVAQGKKP